MNVTHLRRKRVIIPTIAAVAILGVGGTVWTASADNDLQGSERDRVGAAAIEAAGGGNVVDLETSDDRGEAYEAEVRMDDGTEVEISLDQDLNVVSRDTDEADDDNDSDGNGSDGNDSEVNEGRDGDERALGAEERKSVEKAALDAVGGGTVVDLEASDDRGVAYEAEVRMDDGTEWDVDLDSDYKVLSESIDD
ncbi:MAG: hypothetical protein L0H93_00150 [Nocardioides sp.]|nr:hypothetical protein [Nocardioides sp.]